MGLCHVGPLFTKLFVMPCGSRKVGNTEPVHKCVIPERSQSTSDIDHSSADLLRNTREHRPIYGLSIHGIRQSYIKPYKEELLRQKTTDRLSCRPTNPINTRSSLRRPLVLPLRHRQFHHCYRSATVTAPNTCTDLLHW